MSPVMLSPYNVALFSLDQVKNNEKKWRHRSRAANSVVCGHSWPNFKLIQALMCVIVTCKYEKDPIKNSRDNAETPFSPL